MPGISQDELVAAVAIDARGIPSDPAYHTVYAMGSEGHDSYRPFSLSGVSPSDRRSNVGPSVERPSNFPFFPSRARHSLWWRWTAPASGVIDVSTAGSAVDTYLEAYASDAAYVLKYLAANDDFPGIAPASSLKLRVKQGTPYMFRVDSIAPATGDIAIRLAYESQLPQGPPNDDFAGRQLIAGTNAVIEADSTLATSESTDPLSIAPGTVSPGGGRSLWWEWDAPQSGMLTLSTAGSSFDTVLTVTVGNQSGTSRVNGGYNDDAAPGTTWSRVRIPCVGGLRYYIMVDGFSGDGGPLRLALDFQPDNAGQRPPNDDFADATPIEGEMAQGDGTTLGATTEAFEPLASNSIWWKWTAPRDASVYIAATIDGVSTSSPDVTVWTGNSLEGLKPVPFQNPLSKRRFEAKAGTTYHLRFATPVGPARVSFVLNATMPAAGDSRLALTAAGDGTVAIVYLGTAARTGVLKSSINLSDWTDVTERAWQPGERVVLPADPADSRFYKLVLAP
jgi:hypothetical protein